ncbi:MAG: hypothetical protein AABX72_00275 [Nanoarchaeota archaeon]
MKTHPNRTKIVLVLLVLALIASILIFKQPSHTGSAVGETTEQLITSTETINVFVDPATHKVNVITTSDPYMTKELYSPYGQLLRKEYYENNQRYNEADYHYNGNPMSGSKILLSINDHVKVKKEHLEFNYAANPSFPTLVKTSIPLDNNVPPSLDMYTVFQYVYISHLQKTSVNGWYGSTPQEAQQNSISKPPEIHYLLGPKEDIIIFPDFTKSIEITYTLFDGQTRYLTQYRSLTNNRYLELITPTYDGQLRVKTANFKADINNDGTFEENTVREFFYNQNDLPIKYTDTYQNGNTRTYDFDWDRQDKYAVLLGITGPHGPVITSNTYGYDNFIPLETNDLFKI